MALSKHSNKYVEEMLECSVCLDTVTDPQTLQQCFHTFCKECAEQLLAKQCNDPPGINCPVCRTFSAKEEIRGNFFIKDLAEMHRAGYQKDQKLCEQCSEKISEATWKCLDCKTNICKSCQISHLKIPVCKGHRLIPFTEESEMIVDKLVFCTSHPDKPVELYCEPCNASICLMCKATTHDSHKSFSVDDALGKMVGLVEGNIDNMDEYLSSISKSINEVEEKMNETKVAFDECDSHIDQLADERINQIRLSQQILKRDLANKRDTQLDELKTLKVSLQSQETEGETIQRVVKTSLDRARHASLLSELTNGGILEKTENFKAKQCSKVVTQLSKPKVDANQLEWDGMMKSGLTGQIVFNTFQIIFLSGSLCFQKDFHRHWAINLKEYMNKTFKKVFDIFLKGRCTRFAMIGDHIWAPLQDNNCIDIYDFNGTCVKTINITGPVTVESCGNGDICIACKNNGGLKVLSKARETPEQIQPGSFSDICCFYDTMFALEYGAASVVEFTKNGHSTWTKVRSIKLNSCPRLDSNDTLLLKHDPNNTNNEIIIYIASRNSNKISQFNDKGVMLKSNCSGQLYSPKFCGWDNDASILVADARHNIFKIINIESGEWFSTNLKGELYVYDAKLSPSGELWMVQTTPNKFVISKLSHD